MDGSVILIILPYIGYVIRVLFIAHFNHFMSRWYYCHKSCLVKAT